VAEDVHRDLADAVLAMRPAHAGAPQLERDRAEEVGLVGGERAVHDDDPAADGITVVVVVGEQRLVDAVLRDEVGGLRGVELGLRRRGRRVLRLGEELADLRELRVVFRHHLTIS
jgi:hypothetical protein